MPENPTVTILMCTYNGEAHLREQLDSIAAQAYPHWTLAVSDDGSTDGTLAILEEYRARWAGDRMYIFAGPRKGFAANFLSLTCRDEVTGAYYAFCDQDDVWLPEKLTRAMDMLQQTPQQIPALYGTRTILTDSDGNETGLSPLFAKPAQFGNALVQCIAGGNTMVFNDAARSLLREAGADVPVIGHDWWLYQLVTGCGGVVHYDTTPTLRYRQHRKNLMGGNVSLMAKLVRVRLLFKGRFREWNTKNQLAWHRMLERLTPPHRAQLERFHAARDQWFLLRLIGLLRAGIYRQTPLGNCGLVAAALTKTL